MQVLDIVEAADASATMGKVKLGADVHTPTEMVLHVLAPRGSSSLKDIVDKIRTEVQAAGCRLAISEECASSRVSCVPCRPAFVVTRVCACVRGCRPVVAQPRRQQTLQGSVVPSRASR